MWLIPSSSLFSAAPPSIAKDKKQTGLLGSMVQAVRAFKLGLSDRDAPLLATPFLGAGPRARTAKLTTWPSVFETSEALASLPWYGILCSQGEAR
jgi:hypothetical protein